MKIEAATRLRASDDWSEDVTEDVKKHPKEGTFKGSASEIAKELKRLHPDLQSAMSALNFYINRAGSDVPNKGNLEKAKDELRKLYAAK